MAKSVAVFGAGPGLGQAVARRFAREGYAVVLVARRQTVLDGLAAELADQGARAHAVTADLTDTDAIPGLSDRVRARIGDPDVIYYGAAPADAIIPVLDLTPQKVQDLMPLGVYTLLALVRQFLPAMIARSDGAILSAQGASALQGNPQIAGGLTLAAQRNYLQALHAEVTPKGVYVGGLYIDAVIEGTPMHAWIQAAKAEGAPMPDMPTVHPNQLADQLWTMHTTKAQVEATYPEKRLSP